LEGPEAETDGKQIGDDPMDNQLPNDKRSKENNIRDISPPLPTEAEINQHCTLDSIAALSVGQAIHNIVMNAREAMPDGGHLKIVAANAAATDNIVSLAAGNYVKISIADQGR
jgi:signal transduction histidine kinase